MQKKGTSNTMTKICDNNTKEGTPSTSAHYKGAIEPLELMANIMSKDEFVGFLKGNCIKYAWRAGRKQGESIEKDTNKFLTYAHWLHQATNGKPIELGDGKIIIIK